MISLHCEYVTGSPGNKLSVFLVIVNQVAYVLNYEIGTREFGFLCPCCMSDRNRRDIANAIYRSKDLFAGKVRWCCHKGDTTYGDNIVESYLKPIEFCAGSANADLADAKPFIHMEADKEGLVE